MSSTKKNIEKQSEQSLIELAENDEELQAMLREDLQDSQEGTQVRLLSIKILPRNAKFEFPDETEIEEFKGIIIDSNRTNAYWGVDGDKFPSCMSYDGVIPAENSPKKESDSCTHCPLNQFGSAENGVGKKCKNMRRIIVLIEGQTLPMRLTLPPTSLKIYDEYITQLLYKKIPVNAVLTKFSLDKVKSDAGYIYSKIKLSVERILTAKEYREVRQLKSLAKEHRTEKITAEEYTPDEEMNPEAPIEIPVENETDPMESRNSQRKDDLPF